WVRLLIIFGLSVITIILGLVPVEVMKRLLDIAIPSKDINMVATMIVVVFVTHLILLVVNYIQDLMITRLNLNITKKMQTDFFSKLLHVPFSYHSHYNQGQLMERVIDDTEEITGSAFDLVLSPILDIVSVLITIAYMFIVSSKLTLVALAFVPVFIIMTIPVNRIIRKKYTAIKTKYGDIYNVIQEKLAGLKESVTNNQGEYEKKDLDKQLQSYNDLQYDYERFSIKLQSIMEIIGDFAPYTILLYATYLIIEGSFEVGTLLAFAMLMPRLFGPVQELAGKEFEIQTLRVTAERVFSILHDAKPVKEGKDALEQEGDITFKDVSYRFDQTAVLSGVNLTIPKGKMTAIVGESGVGKTTLLHLLLRTLEAKTGKITIDGKDISDLRTDSLRHNIAIVNQEPFLFSETVLHNIVYGHPELHRTMNDIKSAADITNIHKTIMGLPQGYNTKLDQVSRLSAGQKHRITLARAIVREPKVLLLDDPTSGLDKESVRHLIDALEKLKKKTVVVVTNDINILQKADKVVMLTKKGEKTIVTEGTHKGLIKNAKYRKLLS
ncbi:TPA: ABC transporter ATP-binding protein, partial [Candidatus Woesearchaeota archaeon]|nr:ABC transporter ATP-binding protein [Candidatus Woesearchaeota archaeon]